MFITSSLQNFSVFLFHLGSRCTHAYLSRRISRCLSRRRLCRTHYSRPDIIQTPTCGDRQGEPRRPTPRLLGKKTGIFGVARPPRSAHQPRLHCYSILCIAWSAVLSHSRNHRPVMRCTSIADLSPVKPPSMFAYEEMIFNPSLYMRIYNQHLPPQPLSCKLR